MEEAQTINRPALAEKVEALRDLRDQKAAIDKQIKALTKEITKHIPSATERTADKGTMTFVQNRKELVPSVRWFFLVRDMLFLSSLFSYIFSFKPSLHDYFVLSILSIIYICL